SPLHTWGKSADSCTDIKVRYAVNSDKTQVVHLVLTFGNNLIAVNPYVAIPRQYVYMCSRFPVRVCLASVRIAKRDVHSRKFFILQQNPDHLGQSKIRPERQLADA